MKVELRGQITGLGIKKGVVKIVFETNAENTEIDELKGMLDKGVDIQIIDNQRMLPTE